MCYVYFVACLPFVYVLVVVCGCLLSVGNAWFCSFFCCGLCVVMCVSLVVCYLLVVMCCLLVDV